MKKVIRSNHPLVQDRLVQLRDQQSDIVKFRRAVHQISELLILEWLREMPVQPVLVKTPVTEMVGHQLAPVPICLVPVLRAGLGMVDGVLEWLPAASIRHVGMARNEETLRPSVYLTKLDESLEEQRVIILDPMLATGGSAIETIQLVKAVGAKQIDFMCIIAAPEGVEAIHNAHPDVDIYVASVDERLNDRGFIVPGLGDAGDRLFGTL